MFAHTSNIRENKQAQPTLLPLKFSDRPRINCSVNQIEEPSVVSPIELNVAIKMFKINLYN